MNGTGVPATRGVVPRSLGGQKYRCSYVHGHCGSQNGHRSASAPAARRMYQALVVMWKALQVRDSTAYRPMPMPPTSAVLPTRFAGRRKQAAKEAAYWHEEPTERGLLRQLGLLSIHSRFLLVRPVSRCRLLGICRRQRSNHDGGNASGQPSDRRRRQSMMQPINRPGCHRRRRAGGRASLLPSKRLPVQHFIICVFEFRPNCVQVYGVAQKVSHYQIMKNRLKSY